MVIQINKAKIKEPSVKVADFEPKVTKAKMNNAIDALVAAQQNNADINAKIKALQGDLIDEKPLIEKVMTEIQPFYATELSHVDKEFFVESNVWKLKIGKQGVKRIISNMEFVFNKMKKAAFLGACSFPLSALDNYLTKEEQAECVTNEPTKRNVSLVGKAEKAKG